MAVKRKTPARTPARRRPTTKKKMSTTAKVAIGVGVATGLYLIYDYFIKPKDTSPGGATMPPQYTPQQVIQQSQQAPVNVLPAQTPGKPVSPIGTPASKQSWSRIIKYGEKSGEVETLQTLMNRVSKAYGSTTLKVDGDYGKNTEAKKLKILGSSPVNLSTAYKITKKQLEQKNAPADYYDTMYSSLITAFNIIT